MGKKIPKIVQIFDPKMFLYDFLKWTGGIAAILDLRLKTIFVTKRKPKNLFKGKYLISSNHISFEDPVIISVAYWMRRVGFVATSELFNTKPKNFFFRKVVGCIEVDKKNVSMKTFKDVQERLDRGHTVCVFPEGTVDVNSEEHKTYKSGIVMMAIMSNADIIPTYVVKRKNRWHRQKVYIGEKIKLSDHIKSPFPTMEEICALTKYIQLKEEELAKFANK